ncbi:MAG: amidohydrolase [Candidatus Marinimicrobia bacterium]|nr:amidohydrolase [Candidatus Neomarinimicrobiota bacterium]MBL7009748.1 amidohydrolase [Candidatus Neomarinimicrobiota bacterium]MBL7029848.1 amidohydrolase [Candidatus Neomarinimicrobiota bacterium]
MKKHILISTLLFIFACSMPEVDKVYYNGNIWTGDSDNPFAEAIAVFQDRIIFVGNNENAMILAGDQTDKIDLKGAFVTPGLMDNHTHFMWGGFQIFSVNLREVSSKKEFQRRIKEFAQNLPDGAWMLNGNWDHELWGGELPDKSWIDDVIPNIPVHIGRLDGHMSLANQKAMDLANVNRQTSSPAGGIIIKDKDGNPTGVFKDEAMGLISRAEPPKTQGELDRAFQAAMDFALSIGVTQVHDMGSWEDLETYIRAKEDGWLKIRIKAFPWYTNWERILSRVETHGPGDDWLRWDGIKGMIDGSLGSRTGWMYDPYLDDPSTRGIITLEDTTMFKKILRETDRANIQHAVHAIGDRANDWILNQFAEIRQENGKRDRRPRIEHAQHLSKSAVNRFADEHIIPSMQPYHVFDDASWAHKRIDPDRLSRTYYFNTLLKSGANLTFGSDWTVAPLSPIKGIYAAITRHTRDGKNPDGWYPDERLNVEEVLQCYTINNAYAAFREDITGSISMGKYADFVVHSVDFLTVTPDEILNSKVMRTVVGGKDVYILDK